MLQWCVMHNAVAVVAMSSNDTKFLDHKKPWSPGLLQIPRHSKQPHPLQNRNRTSRPAYVVSQPSAVGRVDNIHCFSFLATKTEAIQSCEAIFGGRLLANVQLQSPISRRFQGRWPRKLQSLVRWKTAFRRVCVATRDLRNLLRQGRLLTFKPYPSIQGAYLGLLSFTENVEQIGFLHLAIWAESRSIWHTPTDGKQDRRWTPLSFKIHRCETKCTEVGSKDFLLRPFRPEFRTFHN